MTDKPQAQPDKPRGFFVCPDCGKRWRTVRGGSHVAPRLPEAPERRSAVDVKCILRHAAYVLATVVICALPVLFAYAKAIGPGN